MEEGLNSVVNEGETTDNFFQKTDEIDLNKIRNKRYNFLPEEDVTITFKNFTYYLEKTNSIPEIYYYFTWLRNQLVFNTHNILNFNDNDFLLDLFCRIQKKYLELITREIDKCKNFESFLVVVVDLQQLDILGISKIITYKDYYEIILKAWKSFSEKIERFWECKNLYSEEMAKTTMSYFFNHKMLLNYISDMNKVKKDYKI